MKKIISLNMFKSGHFQIENHLNVVFCIKKNEMASSKKSSPSAKSTSQPVATKSAPVAVAPTKAVVKPPVKVASGRKFLNEAFVRSILKDSTVNKTNYNQITPVALKYIVGNFSLLEDSLRYVLKGSGEYLTDGKSPRAKLSDNVSQLATRFFTESMRDHASKFERHISDLVNSSLSAESESFTNKVIRRIISDFLNAIPDHLTTLQKKSSKTLDLTHVLLALNGGESRSLALEFVSNLFPSFIGVPYNVSDKGRIVPAEAFLQKCAFEGRKKREAYTVLRWYLGYVVDQLSSQDNFYREALTKMTRVPTGTSLRNLIIAFSSVILHGVNGCAGTQEMISRISFVESSINSGLTENFGTFVKVEQPAEDSKAEKKQKSRKSKKDQPKEEQPQQSTSEALEHSAKTVRSSASKKKPVPAQ